MNSQSARLVWIAFAFLLLSFSLAPVAEADASVLPVEVPDNDALKLKQEEAINASVDAEVSKRLPKARFVHKTIIIPHDSKKFRGGEDAASTIDTMLVVADGVGGWANKGVNPGLYSRKLTETITTSFSKLTSAEQDVVDLKKLVHRSNHIAADAHLGSATCTVVRLKDANTLETLNVGDSGYSIHRRSDQTGDLRVVYSSIPGQKGFNFPYQLGGQYGDQVYEPNVTDGPNLHTLQDKDVIVVVSDGIIDNIDPQEYHDCISRYQWSDTLQTLPSKEAFDARYKGYFDEAELVSYSAVADCIARKAYFLGKDQTYFSPFARSAANYGKRYVGGKHDDITVVVAQVERAAVNGEFVVDPQHDDPHKTESIFLYKDSDGPIQKIDTLPTMDEILQGILNGVDPAMANEL